MISNNTSVCNKERGTVQLLANKNGTNLPATLANNNKYYAIYTERQDARYRQCDHKAINVPEFRILQLEIFSLSQSF